MKVVTEIRNQQELEDIKSVMEIFAVNNRIKQLLHNV